MIHLLNIRSEIPLLALSHCLFLNYSIRSNTSPHNTLKKSNLIKFAQFGVSQMLVKIKLQQIMQENKHQTNKNKNENETSITFYMVL